MIIEQRNIRKRCLDISNKGKDGNLQSCFSSMDILWTLYNRVMNWSLNIRNSSSRDYFILSKGQSSLALVTVLENLGLFNYEEIDRFCKFSSRFSMQLDVTKFADINGIENSAGSLGHGLPFAVGVAFANRIKKIDSYVYVLVGDGEMNEGTMWEACAFAGAHKLDKLIVIVDDNDSIGRMLDLSDISTKLKAFGFVVTNADGHNIDSIINGIDSLKKFENMPKALIAKTIRGYGSKTLMENNEWFHKAPNDAELEMLIKEVDVF